MVTVNMILTGGVQPGALEACIIRKLMTPPYYVKSMGKKKQEGKGMFSARTPSQVVTGV